MLRQEQIVCDICGRFISINDLENGDATHKFVEPDNHFGPERYESICLKQVSYIAALIKMGIPETTRPEDALPVILEKNKYLRLAHFMMMNRNDWNEGCDYAETGLSGFAVESDEDREIYKCVSDLCSDGWDGDGRCFRDCEWSYNDLFDKVNMSDPELYTAYKTISDMCSI